MGQPARLVGVIGCGLAVASCGSTMTALGYEGATVEARSEPAGAAAISSTGPSCRTPCSLEVAALGEFTVSFALAGYKPKIVTVRPLEPNIFNIGSGTRYAPSPVFARLELASPSPRARAVVGEASGGPHHARRQSNGQ